VINYRLASAINPPASPSTNLRFHWSFDLQLCLESVLRLASAINPSALPAIKLPTSLETASFGLSFSSASDLRQLLLLRSSLRTNSQSFVGLLAFQLTFQSTSDSRRILHRPVLPSNPAASFRRLPRSPAFPLDRLSTCAEYRILQFCLPTNLRLIIGYRVSDFAFRPASGLRQRCVFQFCLPTNLPTYAGHYVLKLSL
jgi:hypothetical protein